MKIPVSWLREFVDVPVSPEELGDALTMRGFELSSIERGTGVVSREPHAGNDSRPPFDDAVLDFEVMANRPDALSIVGFAREVATIYSLPVRTPELKKLAVGTSPDVKVTIEAPDLCPRYAAAVADVTVGPSPAWLAGRLQAAGVRPINSVVDVTNYVLLEMGQPLHAFDLEKLGGKEIRIRRAKKGERITTLDGVDRALDPEMLVIADAQKAQAVAGVMGGRLSEVSQKTTTIVLESAYFSPKSVRLTSKRLGLKTEASARFERGMDPGVPIAALERAIGLLERVGAGSVRGAAIDECPLPITPRHVRLRRGQIQRVLGQEIPTDAVERILTSLGFALRQDAGGWDVSVPTYRVDVSREVDLIEEAARHFGYDRLPATFPPLTEPAPPSEPRLARDGLVKQVLRAAGCTEALTFSFIDAAHAGLFTDVPAIVPIENPLSAQFAVLRPSLLPGLLASVAQNLNRERADVRLFEVGAIMTRAGESRHVAMAWTGDATDRHWSGAVRPVDYFDVKGLVERVAQALQVEIAFDADDLPSFLVRGRAAAVRMAGKTIGSVGMLTPAIVESAGLAANADVYIAELDLDLLSAARSMTPLTVKPLPRYPSITRDISIIVDEVLPAETVRGTIRSIAPDTLVSVREFDRYQGKGVPERRVSLSLRLTFRSPERTLTDAEVQKAMDAILSALGKAHQAVQR